MEICRTLAGYSYGRADLVRRAMAKKKHDVMEKERKSFVYGDNGTESGSSCPGAIKMGVSEKIANEIFDEMSGFASYAFNKSHAAAYAYLAYQTAYLKCHYIREYMAALMSSVLENTDKLIEYVDECRNNNIAVLRPDINKSFEEFTVEKDGIRYGLLAIKTLGSGVIREIIEERKKGKFINLQDFCMRMASGSISKTAMEYLIKSGAFDGLGANRRQAVLNYPAIMENAEEMYRSNIDGQMGLFSDNNVSNSIFEQLKPAEEYSYTDLLCFEKFATGMYISGHPIDPYRSQLRLMRVPETRTITENLKGRSYADKTELFMCGVMDDMSVRYTSDGRKMGFLSVQDTSGCAECTVFPDTFAKYEKKMEYGNILFISGKVSSKARYNDSFIAETIFDEEELKKIIEKKRLCIKVSSKDREIISHISETLKKYPGERQVCLYLTDMKKFLKPKNISGVLVNDQFYNELMTLLTQSEAGFID